MSSDRPDNRIKVVDLVRTVSIIAVLANHFFGVQFDPHAAHNEPIERAAFDFLMRFALSGAYGVSMFFVLSGFLITRMTAERNPDLYQVNLRQFYIRRLGRIVPLLCLVFSLTFLVNLTASFVPASEIPQQMEVVFNPDVKHFDLTFFICLFTLSLNWLFIFSPYEFGMQLSIMWSIAVEEQFYCFLPPSLRASKSTQRLLPWLIFLIGLGPIARWIGSFYKRNPYASTLWNSFGAFDLIALGVCLFLLERRIRPKLKENPKLSWAICLFGLLVGLLTYFCTTTGDASNRIYGPTLLGIGVFCFLLGGLQIDAFQKLPALLILPGELSYGMYLYHPLILYSLWTYLLGKNQVYGFCVYTLATVALGWFSFRFFEQPVNRLVRKKFL